MTALSRHGYAAGHEAAGENGQRLLQLAGLQTCWVAPEGGSDVAVVLLHGYAMDWPDLAPFAHSLRLRAHFLFPRGAHVAVNRGYAWWPIAEDTRARIERRRRAGSARYSSSRAAASQGDAR